MTKKKKRQKSRENFNSVANENEGMVWRAARKVSLKMESSQVTRIGLQLNAATNNRCVVELAVDTLPRNSDAAEGPSTRQTSLS